MGVGWKSMWRDWKEEREWEVGLACIIKLNKKIRKKLLEISTSHYSYAVHHISMTAKTYHYGTTQHVILCAYTCIHYPVCMIMFLKTQSWDVAKLLPSMCRLRVGS